MELSGNLLKPTIVTQRVARQQLEFTEQVLLMHWCSMQTFTHEWPDHRTSEINLRDMFDASLNGTYLHGNTGQRIGQWKKMEKAGAKTSAPDLSLNYPIRHYHGMKIEMKKRREDFASPSAIRDAVKPGQSAYIHLLGRLGYYSVICYGWIEAAKEICVYMDWDPKRKGL